MYIEDELDDFEIDPEDLLVNEENTTQKDEEFEKLFKLEEIVTEVNRTELDFKDFPSPIKNKILYQSGLTLLINIILILVMIFFSFKIELVIILFVLDLFLIGNIKYLYDTLHYMDCRIFDGFVLNYDTKGVPGTSTRYKRITICDAKSQKFITFDYYGKAKIGQGFPVTLYLAKNEEIVIKEDIPYVKNVLAVTFGTNAETEELMNENEEIVNIEEYLNN